MKRRQFIAQFVHINQVRKIPLKSGHNIYFILFIDLFYHIFILFILLYISFFHLLMFVYCPYSFATGCFLSQAGVLS